jgi:NAD(P)-dependent dehydrogenase (short-subunit alcohol dehydrogenase family)
MTDYQAPADLLQDRVILVTGAGGAIGGAAAKCFAAHGATVVLVGRTQGKLEQTYDAIVQAGHAEPVLCPLDLEKASPQDYQTIADSIAQQFGRLDGMLHAAAMLGSLTPLEHYDLPLWSKVMQINLNAPFLLTRACLGLLKQSADASVIFSAADVGRHGRAYWGAYAVAHAAVENLAEVLADELEANTHIRVNSLNPGTVRSRLRALAYPGEDPNTLPEADSVITAYLYLMGPNSAGISGQRLDAADLPATAGD